MKEMVFLIVASSLLMAYMDMNVVGESYDGVINVGGRVRCMNCTEGQGRLKDSKPIQGSGVALTCYDRSQAEAVYYGTDETDETGIYQLTVTSYINGKKLDPRNCFVRLIYPADLSCSIATAVNGGSTGVRLEVPIRVNANITKYRLHSFFYATNSCNRFDKTETGSIY